VYKRLIAHRVREALADPSVTLVIGPSRRHCARLSVLPGRESGKARAEYEGVPSCAGRLSQIADISNDLVGRWPTFRMNCPNCTPRYAAVLRQLNRSLHSARSRSNEVQERFSEMTHFAARYEPDMRPPKLLQRTLSPPMVPLTPTQSSLETRAEQRSSKG
jgi:hypothetical protein